MVRKCGCIIGIVINATTGDKPPPGSSNVAPDTLGSVPRQMRRSKKEKKEVLKLGKVAGQNGAYVEILILGHPSNSSNLVDDEAGNIEIKSCRERHKKQDSKGRISTCMGRFKINFEQHQHLVNTNGTYCFVVIDEDLGKIIHRTTRSARGIEDQFQILGRKLTKHHYYSINWRAVF